MSADQDWDDEVNEPSCTEIDADAAPGTCTRTSIVAVEPCAETMLAPPAHHAPMSTAQNRPSAATDTGLRVI